MKFILNYCKCKLIIGKHRIKNWKDKQQNNKQLKRHNKIIKKIIMK